MEAQGNNPPPPQFNHNPYTWDHPPPPPPPPPPPNFEWSGGGFSGNDHHHHHHHHHYNDYQNNHHHDFHPDAGFHGGGDHQFLHFNEDSFSGGGYGHSEPQFNRKRKFDYAGGGSYPKLFVGGIPRTMTEEEIRHLFQEHGNVVEVVLRYDKWTGEHQEYCFVKYASTEEADSAITALHNQFPFPGAMGPLRVKYADRERERLGSVHHQSSLPRPGLVRHDSTVSAPATLGAVQHKVYVNGLNKEASEKEITEIFSSYGDVADVYILRDRLKQRRDGTVCAFVGFAQRCMAVAAINGLNGTYMMRGCDRPLIVRFADPKKPKKGDLRPAPNSAYMRGSNLPNASHVGNSSASTQESTTDVKAGIFSPVANQLQCPASSEMQPPLCPQPFSPSRFSQMSLQESQTLPVSSQSSRQMDSQPQTPVHRTSTEDIEQQHDCQSPQPCRDDVESNSFLLSSEPAACALPGSDLAEGPEDCDWSEHICPDGYKYYFNCVTCESRWEKPEEFSLYEERMHWQQLQNRSSQEPHPCSTLEAPSSEDDCEIQAAQHQRQSCDFDKPQLPLSCAVEHSHEQVQVETSPLGGPAVQ